MFHFAVSLPWIMNFEFEVFILKTTVNYPTTLNLLQPIGFEIINMSVCWDWDLCQTLTSYCTRPRRGLFQRRRWDRNVDFVRWHVDVDWTPISSYWTPMVPISFIQMIPLCSVLAIFTFNEDNSRIWVIIYATSFQHFNLHNIRYIYRV